MGDRALVIFHDGERVSPVTYLHRSGYQVPELLAAVRERMQGREGDVDYTAARFIGLAHESLTGNLSLGVWNGPETVKEARAIESHGDAGVFVVDCRTWRVHHHGGYGFSESGTPDGFTLVESDEPGAA